MKKEKGITLIALVITVILMVIIASMAITTGLDSLDETELQGFYTQLDIIQKKVDEIASTTSNYNELGETLDITQKNKLQSILRIDSTFSSSFRYFTIEQLENVLGLSDMDYAVFIHFASRTVVAEEGITIKGITYYVSNSATYYVDSTGSKGEVDELKINAISYGKEYYFTSNNNLIYQTITPPPSNTLINVTVGKSDVMSENKYKIIVQPKNKEGKDMQGGSLKYKKTSSTSWETATGLEFVITELTRYNVQYEDKDRNKITVTINVSLVGGVPKVTIQN